MAAPPPNPPLAYVLGAPTASGKTAVALRLAEAYGLEIVSADAMQVYRGLNIGTAKPTLMERERVRHHLVDVADPDESFSVAAWLRAAEAAILDVHARGGRALVVGGTGFYLEALATGLPTTPPADPAVQEPLWRRLEAEGLEPLVQALRAAAPADAERAQRNPRRVIRALEILKRTGRPPSSFERTPPRVRVDRTWLLPSLEALEPRIAARVRAMVDAGLVEEAGSLDPARSSTASQAIGYAEAAAVARGEMELEAAVEAIVTATRRYARRQRTWFRRHAAERRLEATADAAEPELRAWLSPA